MKVLSRISAFLAVVMAMALWLSSNGWVRIEGFSTRALESMYSASGLSGPPAGANLFRTLSLLPLSPVFGACLAQSLFLVGSFVVLWLTLRRIWSNNFGPTLCCAWLFFGAHNCWIASPSTEASFIVALKALAVAAVVSAKVPLLAGVVLGLTLMDPPSGMHFFIILSFLCFRRREAYGLMVSGACSVGIALLLAFLSTEFTLRPSFAAFHFWLLIPILSLVFNRELAEARGHIYGCLLLGAVVSGQAEVVTAVCLGDLSVLAQRKLEAADSAVTWKPFGAVFLLLCAIAILPGEQYLNRNILIPAQKKRIPLSSLAYPFSLKKHADRLGQDSWRLNKPYPGMRPKEINLLRRTTSPVRILTLGQLAEDRRLSLAYALACSKELSGWTGSHQLRDSSLICKTLGKNVVISEDTTLFRGQTEADSRIDSGPDSLNAAAKEVVLDLRRLANQALSIQVLSEDVGAAYELEQDEQREHLYFEDDGAIHFLGLAPGKRVLRSLNKKTSRELELGPFKLELSFLDPLNDLPSRSLVSRRVRITNRGTSTVTDRQFESLRLTILGGKSYSSPRQNFPKSFILFPEESLEMSIVVTTPEGEGVYPFDLELKTLDGKRIELPVLDDPRIQTWRRLPAVGTWVEEP